MVAVGAMVLVGWLLDRIVGQYDGLAIGDGPLNGFYWPAGFVVLAMGLSLWQQRHGLGSGPKAGFGSWLLAGVSAALLLFAFLGSGEGSYLGAGALLLVCGLRQRDRLLGWVGAVMLLLTLVEHAVIRPMLAPAVVDGEFEIVPDQVNLDYSGVPEGLGEALVLANLVLAVLIIGLGVTAQLIARRGTSPGVGLTGDVAVATPVTGRASVTELLGTLGMVRSRVRADRRATSTPLLAFGAVVSVGSLLEMLLRPTEGIALISSEETPGWMLTLGVYWSGSLLAAVVGLWWWQRRQLARLGVGPGVGFGLPLVLVLLNQLSWFQFFPYLPAWFPALQVSYLFNALLVVGATLLAAGSRQRNGVLCWWGAGIAALGIADSAVWMIPAPIETAEQFQSFYDLVGRAETVTGLTVGVALLMAGGVARWRRS